MDAILIWQLCSYNKLNDNVHNTTFGAIFKSNSLAIKYCSVVNGIKFFAMNKKQIKEKG